MSSSPPPDNAPAPTVELVAGPLLCAICAEAVTKGTGFQYGITNRRNGHKLYAYVHGGNCDAAFKKTTTNPDLEPTEFVPALGFPGEEGEPAE